jgi:hypothetical protein
MKYYSFRPTGWLALVYAAAITTGCPAQQNSAGSGGTTSGAAGSKAGGTTAAAGAAGGTTAAAGTTSNTSSPTGGTQPNSKGGSSNSASGGTVASGGDSTPASSGGNGSQGGATGSGGVTAVGGSSTPGSSGGSKPVGGSSSGSGGSGGSGASKGGATGSGGVATGGVTTTGGTSIAWTTLPPPRQCGNAFATQGEGCVTGKATSTCGGNCTSFVNACQDTQASKPNMPVAFICPQWILFSDAMKQAATLDGNTAFNYAIVGHDVDYNGIDGTAQSACCQCYQLVYDNPSNNDNQARVTPGDPNSPSAIQPLPPPLIVQSFNMGATTDSFDVFMAGGGFGSNNACDPKGQPQANSGEYIYTSFPPDGANNGGVKGATAYTECKTAVQWVTTASLSTPACQSKIQTECNMFAAPSATTTADSIRSCIQSNNPQTYYHLNWNVYAMKVECPTHLTDLTGCKLAPQGLPAVNPNVTTATQAAANSSFRSKSGSGTRLWTSTMEDCCMPSCAFRDHVTGAGLTAQGLYNSFYSCDQSGVPMTQPQ